MLTDYFYVQLRQSVRVVLPLECTKEVISLQRGEICPIPGIAPALMGVVNQRGRMLWVLDLSDLLKLPPSPAGLRSWSSMHDSLTSVVIAGLTTDKTAPASTPLSMSCVVATLQGVVSLNPETFKSVPAKISPALRGFFTGVVEIERLPVAVLNINAIFKSAGAYGNSLVP